MPENIDNWEIRADQRYLYEMVKAVASGECSERLASIKPGPVNQARWLTTASRILRLYVTKPSPSNDLKNLALFVMKVYAPFWFLVKSQPLAIYGSRHIFQYIQWTRQLPESVQNILRPSISRNAFYCHPENILLSMITDEDKAMRIAGYEKILHARNEPSQVHS